MYQQIQIQRYGDTSGLVMQRREEELVPASDEVVVRVKYSGINFADVQMRLGYYYDAPPRPFVPGYEVSGVVESVGAGVTDLKPGDEVLAGTYFGGYASKVKLGRHQVFRLPKRYDLKEAAALPVNYFTAQLALVEMGRVRRGDKVLIDCASGGVGTIAMQMASKLGAQVVGLTSSASKKAFIEGYGATAYTAEELERDPSIAGFDFVLNSGGGKTVRRHLARTKYTGRIVCMGLNTGVRDGRRNPLRVLKAAVDTPIFPVLSLMNLNRGVFGLNALRILEDPEWVRRLTALLEEDLVRLELKPHVDRVFPSSEIGRAHELLQTRKARGKLLIAWD